MRITEPWENFHHTLKSAQMSKQRNPEFYWKDSSFAVLVLKTLGIGNFHWWDFRWERVRVTNDLLDPLRSGVMQNIEIKISIFWGKTLFIDWLHISVYALATRSKGSISDQLRTDRWYIVVALVLVVEVVVSSSISCSKGDPTYPTDGRWWKINYYQDAPILGTTVAKHVWLR